MPEETKIYRFGVFELDLERWQLRREGREVPLQDQPLRLLQVLVQRPWAVVSREELREELWEPGTHVDYEGGINSAVRRLREALDDRADNPRFVQTVPKQGYRFIAPVQAVGPTSEPSQPASNSTPSPEPSTTLPVDQEPKIALPPELLLSREWQPFRKRPTVKRWPWLLLGLLLGSAGFLLMRSAAQDAIRNAPPPSMRPAAQEAETGSAGVHLERARFFAGRRSREGLEKAIAEYQSALAEDPRRADAYAGLATAYVILGAYDYWRPRDAFEPARRMAEKALELDDGSAEAHMALSMVAAVADWDWNRAETLADRAMSLNPSFAAGDLWRAILLSSLGRHEEALAAVERSLAREPVDPVFNTAKGWILFFARRPEEAIAQSHHALELAPAYYDAWDNLKWVLLTEADEAEAVHAWARAETLDGGDGEELLERYAREGLTPLFRSSVEKKLRLHKDRYSPPYDLVLDYTALGETDQALDWLERSYAERETDLLSLAVDPRLDPLRDDPRFQNILERLDLPGP